MEQSPAPANVVDSSFQLHRKLNLPPCYRFHASDEQLLEQFLLPFVERKKPKTCPIHNISDVYSSTPEALTGNSFLDEKPSFLDEKPSFLLGFLDDEPALTVSVIVCQGAYEQGGDDQWLFFATKKYDDVTARDARVTTDGGGLWIKKGGIKKFFVNNNTLLGFKRTQDFYAQGHDLSYWRMEELSLRIEVCIDLYH